jgi:23S rRNA pseudouridine1911/1915/1917 synthase
MGSKKLVAEAGTGTVSAAIVRVAIDPSREGMTIAAVVRHALTNQSGDAVPWSRARDLCRTGRVKVNGVAMTDDAIRVQRGAVVEITPNAPKTTRGVLPRESVLYLDDDVIVVDKPKGVVTVPFSEGERDTLVDRVRALLSRIEKRERRDERKGSRDAMVGVVQRLDKDTTGALVFARTMKAKRSLEDQLRVHSVERRYLAIAHGDVPNARFESFLVQNRGDGLRGSWGAFRTHEGPPPPEAKSAVTHVRKLEELKGATLVECRLETGRQHQIRIHLAEAGHPLVGEPVYIRDYTERRIDAARPMLHAAVLGFVHPRTSEQVRFESPMPHDFETCLASLRKVPG